MKLNRNHLLLSFYQKSPDISAMKIFYDICLHIIFWSDFIAVANITHLNACDKPVGWGHKVWLLENGRGLNKVSGKCCFNFQSLIRQTPDHGFYPRVNQRKCCNQRSHLDEQLNTLSWSHETGQWRVSCCQCWWSPVILYNSYHVNTHIHWFTCLCMGELCTAYLAMQQWH